MSESWSDGAGRVRKSRTEHPNSTGGWTGSLAEYDILGQVKRSTVPTEINSSYEPAGDDATRGWLWSSQEYDWKGRVTRSIPTDSNGSDGKDQLISYEGCGCAGGQITTIQSELVPRNDQSNTNARRTQKIYADIIGRTYKTEVMNWDAATPCTTTVQTFNGRDQVTKTRQYSGSESSSTYQDISMIYDGHGRMKTRHYPVEDANTNTTWIYNNDDSIQQIVDPRNAITNFTYNSRGLVEQVSYDPPANQTAIPDAPTVNFTYDALGNRTQMTDGTGTQTYNYNELSQLTSETKDFTDLTNNLTISYTYHLGGGLKSITDPFSSTVNYTNDKAGRVTAVSGTPFGQNTTGNYANNIKYRAFGQLKQIDYTMPSETSQIKLEYDNRLRVSHSEASLPSASGGFVMKADYSYFADGHVQSKDDLLDNKWDRTMKYDHAGRLTFNQFGMGLGSDNQTYKRVYEQNISYDGFSQMTTRSGEHWGNDIGYTESYTNGRITTNPNLDYDAAGNIVHTDEDSANPHVFQNTIFDASGRQLGSFGSTKGRWGSILNMVTERKTEIEIDGDGHPVVEKSGYRYYHISDTPPTPGWTPDARMFQVWSTVLGSSLTSVLPDGSKQSTKVFADRAVIAGQGVNDVGWKTADPITGTTGNFNSYGFTKDEIEPLGQSIRQYDPTDPPEPPPSDPGPIGGADDPQWQCTPGTTFYGNFQGMPWHCQKALLFNAGTTLPWEFEPPANPHGIGSAPHDSGHQRTGTASDRNMPVNIAVTTKPQSLSSGGGAVPASHIPSADGCTYDGHGNPSCAVQSERAFDDSIPDFVDASVSGGQIQTKTVPFDVPRIETALGKVLANQGCKDFIANLLNIASKNTNKKLAENGDILKMFQLAKNNLTRERPKGFDPTGSGTVLGSFKKKNAGIFAVGSPSQDAKDQFSIDVKTILHELIHLAAFKGNYFSDQDLADIISKSPDGKIPYTGDNAVYPNNPYDPKYTQEQASSMKSGYWDRVLKAKCFTDKDGKDLDVRTLVNW